MQLSGHEESLSDADFDQLRLRCDRRAARRARRWLAKKGYGSEHPLTLLAHELVTNSVEHSRAQHVWLTLLTVPDGVRVEVVDDGGGDPRPAEPGPLAESGRGLRWVEALSDTWGVARRKLTHVWFQLPGSSRRKR